jgi:GNAT superfamily N-acetyltransferase
MHPPHLDLPDAVETGFFLLPDLPGELTSLPIPGLRGRVTPVSSPYANVVGAARLTAQSADRALLDVINYFTGLGLSFGWRLGPSSTPPDLGSRLLAHGLQRKDDINGLSCYDLDQPPPHDPGLTIRKAASTDLYLLVDLLKEAFSVHSGWGHILGKAYLEPRAQSEGRIAVYLAFEDGIAEPVAFGSLYTLPDRPVVMLSGAATRPAYRRRGIYTSLVAHRLQEAHRSGAVAAVIQAASESALACLKLGFSRFCAIEHYTLELA